jgi:8-hydroxy-5-deazaflavin:NADPH oxidoreductase
MNVLVIGAGNMGAGFVKQLHAAGHRVTLVSRSKGKAEALAAQYRGVKLAPAKGAAEGQDAVVLAVPYAEAANALREVGGLEGKVVIDITNPLTADYMGLTLGHSTSAGEEIARAAPGALVVKGFNTLFAQVLEGGADFGRGGTVSVFVASDDAAAKRTAVELAESMGFEAVNAGGLKNARYLEPLAGLNVYFGYGAGLGTGIAPAWVHRG